MPETNQYSSNVKVPCSENNDMSGMVLGLNLQPPDYKPNALSETMTHLTTLFTNVMMPSCDQYK